jgi:glycogen operon protein
MTQHDWSAGAQRLGFFLNGDGIAAPGPEGERVRDSSFLLLFNASAEDARFMLPSRRFGAHWTLVLDTADPGAEPSGRRVRAQAPVGVTARSLVLLRRVE